MIEKRFPRKLNKSADSRLLGPDEMSDAININTSEDTRSSGGNAGVIKPIKSNKALDGGFVEFEGTDKTVVGKAICEKYNVIYFFVHENGGDNGIYAYDPDGYFPNSSFGSGVEKIFANSILSWSSDAFVKADITYVQRNYVADDGTLYEDVPYLFFTDNQSEPKKINVLRAIENDFTASGLSLEDFVLVCPKTPQNPIISPLDSANGGWGNEPEFNSNEFLSVEGFQFCYQLVYKDGSESALSAFSKIYVPPGYLNYTGSTDVSALNADNAIDLAIPTTDLSAEVESVKLLTRRGNTGSWFNVDEIAWAEDIDYWNTQISAGNLDDGIPYRFLNTTVNSAVSNDVQSKQFDNVPIRAEAQTIIGNRLMYGNYLDGFDNVDLDSTLVPVLEERPEDFQVYDVKVLESTVPNPSDYDQTPVTSLDNTQDIFAFDAFPELQGRNKNIGFTIDGESLPGTIEKDSLIRFSFTVNPERNFHIYNAIAGYHQSPQMGEDFDVEGLENSGQGTIDGGWVDGTHPDIFTGAGDSPVTGHPRGIYWQNTRHSGAEFIQKHYSEHFRIPAITAFGTGCTYGESTGYQQDIQWEWEFYNPTDQTVDPAERVTFGTSAGNPLIVQGKPITLNASFKAAQDLTKEEVVRAIALVLNGGENSWEVSQSGGTGPADNFEFRSIPDGTVESSFLEQKAYDISYPSADDLEYEVELGLGDGSTFPDTSPLAKLIVMAGQVKDTTSLAFGAQTYTKGSVAENATNNIVKGFFILNKAKVKFGIYHDSKYSAAEDQFFPAGSYDFNNDVTTSERNNRARARFGIYVKEITVPNDEEAVLSCARRPLPGASWWCFSPFKKNESAFSPSILRSGILNEYSLFDYTDSDGNQQPGLSTAASLAGFPMGHNVGVNASPPYPQDYIPTEDTNGPYGFFCAAQNGIWLIDESRMFLDYGDLVGNDVDAPWRSIFGGLKIRDPYANQMINDYEEETNQEGLSEGNIGEDLLQEVIPFFRGTTTEGVPMFSLMDGKGGPGGGGVGHNTPYQRYVAVGANGPNSDDYARGVGNLGSALVVGTDWGGSATDPNFPILPPSTGGFGPALNNNILFAKIDSTGASGGINNGIKKSSAWVLDNTSGATETYGYYTDPSTTDNIYDELENISSVPMLHQSPDSYGASWRNNCWYPKTTPHVTPSYPPGDTLSMENQLSNPSPINANISITAPGGGGKPTFKAGANHALGVVFYDARGRASNVNPIGSVYVPWFADRPEGFEGAVGTIKSTLSGDIPEGATQFRYVYSGNTSNSRFVQYAVEGAFVEDAPGTGGEFSGNIFVSLNSLQFTPNSFAKAQGARGLDGSKDIYTFREGDRLRIISYFETTADESRVFVSDDYEFNIVDQVVLANDSENPIYQAQLPLAKRGSFLVLENNINAIGFTYDQIADSGNTPDTNGHNWNKRCVVEIYSPKTAGDEENLVYHEIGPVYPIEEFGNTQEVVGGDTWWRSMPVQFRPVDGTGFVSSISGTNSYTQNFLPYNLESQVFSEKVRNSDVWSKGKPKIVLPDAERSVKSSSITYSDKDNPISKIFSLTSFNPAKAQYKDLPPEFGDINYMLNNDDSIFVIQSNRCSSVPVNRNLITDGGGAETLVAARQVLGTERYYAGHYGCDNNPESVCNVDNTVYFASKSNRQVYKFNPSSGIQVVSDLNMKTYFKKLFEQAEIDERNGEGRIKVVGGYDPYNDTYVISIFNQSTEDPVVVVDDDVDGGTDEGSGGDSGGGLDEGGGDGGNTDGGGGPVILLEPDSVTVDIREVLSQAPDVIRLDANNDGAVNTADLLSFLAAFGLEDFSSPQATLSSDDVTFNYDN